MGKRIALVIGNSAYVSAGELRNPANDAKTLAGAIRRVGFTEVIETLRPRSAQMTAALKDFGDRAAGADWAVIDFAGHGVEMAAPRICCRPTQSWPRIRTFLMRRCRSTACCRRPRAQRSSAW